MNIATTDTVDRDQLRDFLADKRKYILVTTRSDGRPQMSPVTGALDDRGRLLISTYPTRAKGHEPSARTRLRGHGAER